VAVERKDKEHAQEASLLVPTLQQEMLQYAVDNPHLNDEEFRAWATGYIEDAADRGKGSGSDVIKYGLAKSYATLVEGRASGKPLERLLPDWEYKKEQYRREVNAAYTEYSKEYEKLPPIGDPQRITALSALEQKYTALFGDNQDALDLFAERKADRDVYEVQQNVEYKRGAGFEKSVDAAVGERSQKFDDAVRGIDSTWVGIENAGRDYDTYVNSQVALDRFFANTALVKQFKTGIVEDITHLVKTNNVTREEARERVFNKWATWAHNVGDVRVLDMAATTLDMETLDSVKEERAALLNSKQSRENNLRNTQEADRVKDRDAAMVRYTQGLNALRIERDQLSSKYPNDPAKLAEERARIDAELNTLRSEANRDTGLLGAQNAHWLDTQITAVGDERSEEVLSAAWHRKIAGESLNDVLEYVRETGVTVDGRQLSAFVDSYDTSTEDRMKQNALFDANLKRSLVDLDVTLGNAFNTILGTNPEAERISDSLVNEWVAHMSGKYAESLQSGEPLPNDVFDKEFDAFVKRRVQPYVSDEEARKGANTSSERNTELTYATNTDNIEHRQQRP
jgi:hypothetical protein